MALLDAPVAPPAPEANYTDVTLPLGARLVDNAPDDSVPPPTEAPANGRRAPVTSTPGPGGEQHEWYDPDAELTLAASLMVQRHDIDEALTIIGPGDLSAIGAPILAAVLELAATGEPMDSGVVARKVGDRSLIKTLDTRVTAAWRTYARHLADLARRRRLGETARLLYAAAVLGDEDAIEQARDELATERTPQALGDRAMPGGAFILDVPTLAPAVWGRDDQVLWAEGEPLYIVGPTGVGKTTLVGQLVFARLGLIDPEVLGWPVTAAERILYLACDRPNQIRRAFRRLAHDDWREELDEHLVVWKGPPAQDIARHPESLLALAKAARADTVVIDSLKDVAIGISDDEVGAGLNNAVQRCIAEGVEVLGLHHQRKGQDGKKPKTLEDVYGSTWIPAGAGSVILLWGSAGDLVVEFIHLKQPAAPVGPLQIEHDHAAGRSSLYRGFDALRFLRNQPHGATAADAARQWFEKTAPTDNERKKAQRAFEGLVRKQLAHRQEGSTGGDGGAQGARYFATRATDEVDSEPADEF